MKIAKGTFNPELQPVDFFKAQAGCGRMTIDKSFKGALEGHSYGEMLSSMGSPDGNAVYVAVERFEGSLEGKRGAFSLMHYGRMDNGEDSLVFEVVPGSGTEGLKDIQGSVSIDIDDSGVHSYTFEYDIL